MSKFTYTYELFGIMADGGNSIQSIEASCQEEAEIIIESFHDGEYLMISNNDPIVHHEFEMDYEWIEKHQAFLEEQLAQQDPDYFDKIGVNPFDDTYDDQIKDTSINCRIN